MRLFCYLLTICLSLCLSTTVSAVTSTSNKTAKKTAAHKVPSKVKKTRSLRKRTTQVSSSIKIPSKINNEKQLTYLINRIVKSTDQDAKVGIYIKNLANDDTLYVHNIYRPLVPASIMKLLTAEAALLYLGSDYRFSTQILTNASAVHDGVLQGDIYIVLSGDPTLTYDDLLELMLSLQQEGVTAIKGNVYIDNTAYDERFYGPGWGGKDKQYCYGAPISASIINHNCLPLRVQPARFSGSKAKVITSSRHFYPRINNDVVTKANRSRSCSLRMTTTSKNGISLDGCMRKGNDPWGMQYVVTDIPEYNRQLFKSVLRKMSIDVYGTVTFASAPDKLSLISSHESDELPELIREMLKKSDNVIAGALFKKLGQLYTNKPGSWENGGKAVSSILAKDVKLHTQGMRLIDGSGLSKNNMASPAQFMQLLSFAYFSNKTSDNFVSALPISGVDGTLKHRMTNITRKVRAKTGTISGVVSLAGYALSRNRQPLAFVIIANGDKANNWRYRDMQDKIVTALTHYNA